jgi:hypothetical protein
MAKRYDKLKPEMCAPHTDEFMTGYAAALISFAPDTVYLTSIPAEKKPPLDMLEAFRGDFVEVEELACFIKEQGLREGNQIAACRALSIHKFETHVFEATENGWVLVRYDVLVCPSGWKRDVFMIDGVWGISSIEHLKEEGKEI